MRLRISRGDPDFPGITASGNVHPDLQMLEDNSLFNSVELSYYLPVFLVGSILGLKL